MPVGSIGRASNLCLCAGGVVGGVAALALLAAGLLLCTGRWKPLPSASRKADENKRQEDAILNGFNIDGGRVCFPLLCF